MSTVAQSQLMWYLLQGVGRVEDCRAGAAGGRGRGLGAARGGAGARALHSEALLVIEAQLGQQLLVPVHGHLKHGGGAVKGRSERKTGTEVVQSCVSPATL